MTGFHDDRFLVFVRADRSLTNSPENCESYLISVSTYEEARRIQREYRSLARECVIRYLGPAGGGD
jgi:hypothetical protein